MSWIKAADPLALVAIQSGRVGTPAEEIGAVGGAGLDQPQRATDLGEPVPIAFARWRNGAGGVLISPGATEARFENDASNNVTAYYHLVLSEGEIDSIPVKDVFQRSCRVGSHTQTYNRRAGTWAPGNYIVQRVGYTKPECPYYCGSVGTYPGMSTLSFQVTIPNGFDQWDRQVHLFIRGGMHVTRLYDSTTGPSDNYADLVYWMLSNSGRVPSSLIDTAALTSAATFLEVNGFTCNCWLTDSRNYADLVSEWSPYFLLGESSQAGKKGLRPLLPTVDGAINTGVIDWEYIFTEDTILPGTLEIEYTSLADRMPFVAQVTWRQQLDDDIGLIRTAEVRYAGTAESGPYEAHDLSAFCTNEAHAVKVGAYILSKRVRVTHTIRFSARPQAHNQSLVPGDIVRVKLARKATAAGPAFHDYLYQVERITKTLSGDVAYECSHFPIDSAGKSLIALDVAAATGTGILLSSYKTGVGCDINSASDDTIPTETYIEIGDVNDPAGELGTDVSTGAGAEVTLPSGAIDLGSGSSGGGGWPDIGPDDDSENPDDDQDRQPDSPYDSWPDGYPTPNDPEWPEGWPSSTTPGPNGYVEPNHNDDWDLSPLPAGYRYLIESSGASSKSYIGPPQPGESSCRVQGTLTYAGQIRYTTKNIKGLYRVYGPAGTCAGSKTYRDGIIYTDGTSGTVPGGLLATDRLWGYEVTPHEFTITKVTL